MPSTIDLLHARLAETPDDHVVRLAIADYWDCDAPEPNPGRAAGYRALVAGNLVCNLGSNGNFTWYSWNENNPKDRSMLPWRWRLGRPTMKTGLHVWWYYGSRRTAEDAAADRYPGEGNLAVLAGNHGEAVYWLDQWGYPQRERIILNSFVRGYRNLIIVKVGTWYHQSWTDHYMNQLLADRSIASEWVMTDDESGEIERVRLLAT